MSPMSHTVPDIAPSRRILLPLSFAGCGGLLLLLFLALVGCGKFLEVVPPEEVATPNNHNAILCSCECTGAVETAVPSANTIRAGADDVTQTLSQSTVALTNTVLVLGEGNNVGLRFENLGLPPKAVILAAHIEFTSTQADNQTTDLDVFAVDSSDAPPFVDATNLRDGVSVPLVNAPVIWPVPAWTANERGTNQRTPDLKALVKTIVDRDGYAPDSAIAFVIRGSGRRIADSFEGVASGRPPSLTVTYEPRKYTKEFLACGNPAEAAAVCGERAESNLTSIAQQCKLANTCTCTVKTGPNVDTTAFSSVCNGNCPKVVAPDNCDPDEIAKTTAATDNHTPVCIASSPLGSVLFGQLSACDIDPGQSTVTVRVFDEDDSLTRSSPARGRVEFRGKPCPGGSCGVGMLHRMNAGDLTFDGNLLEGTHVLKELSGVGASSLNALLADTGAGTFGPGFTKHSVRGREEGGDTVALFKAGNKTINVGLGGWQPGGVCTLNGMVIQSSNVEMSADLTGRLVNQPPTASVSAANETVQCNAPGRAEFALDAAAHDPDNNAASFAWLRGGRKGQLVGQLPTIELDQPVGTTTPYVFKVIDTFGQYDEAFTSVSVVDTIAPTVTAPSDRTAECAGHNGTPVAIGMATASDVCDASPTIFNDAPALFTLGTSTVTWSARDASNNTGTDTQTVKIIDTTPPQLTLSLSPTSLWSPNHALVPIAATITVTDLCDPNPTVRLVSITSSEPENSTGDGNTTGDIQDASFGTDDRNFQLRAERRGPGNSRVYTVIYEARDGSGNTTLREATVTVPHNR